MNDREKRDRKHKIVTFEIPVRDLKALRSKADAEDLSVSQLIRRALRLVLESGATA